MKITNNVFVVSDGMFKLDGGAMFGVVPKPLWDKLNPADEHNRITLGLNCVLVKGKENVLIDAGIGNKHDEKFASIFGIVKDTDLIEELKKHKIDVKDIDKVILTHLHFDHAGWVTVKDDEGNAVPTFPNAEYVIQKGEWEEATNPHERNRASYLKENVFPLKDQLMLVEGNVQINDQIKILVTPGHTAFHQAVMIEDEGKKIIYLGDLIPTTSHIKIPYVMGYDLYPLDTIKSKKELLKKIVDEEIICVFEHDPKIKAAYIKEEDNKFMIKEALG